MFRNTFHHGSTSPVWAKNLPESSMLKDSITSIMFFALKDRYFYERPVIEGSDICWLKFYKGLTII